MTHARILLLSTSFFAFLFLFLQLAAYSFGPQLTPLHLGFGFLGFGIAGLLGSVDDKESWTSNVLLHPRIASIGLIVSILAVCALIAGISSWYFNHLLELIGRSASLTERVLDFTHYRFYALIAIGSSLAVCFLLFGLQISQLFRAEKSSGLSKLYFFDMIGAPIGGLIYYCFSKADLIFGVLPVIISLIVATNFLSPTLNRRQGVAVFVAIILAASSSWIFINSFEFKRVDQEFFSTSSDIKTAKSLKQFWNSNNGFDLMQLGSGKSTRHYVGLGGSFAAAGVEKFTGTRKSEYDFFLEPLKAISSISKALVLFAGVGRDLVILNSNFPQAKLTGVELNAEMIEVVKDHPEFKLDRFFDQPGISIAHEDARSFLEKTKDSYELILYSYSGTNMSQHLGIPASSLSYSYTVQGVSRALSRLSKKGLLVFIHGNKLKTLITLAKIAEGNPEFDLTSSIVLFKELGAPAKDFYVGFDNLILFVRPAGFSKEELVKLKASFKDGGEQLLIFPGMDPDKIPFPYKEVLSYKNLSQAIQNIQSNTDYKYRLITDSHPFYFDNFRWMNLFKAEAENTPLEINKAIWGDAQTATVKMMLQWIVGVATFTFLCFLMMCRRGLRSSLTLPATAYFALIGVGFMAFEITCIHRVNLWIGAPGLSLIVGLCSLFASSAVGGLLGSITMRSMRLMFAGLITFLIVTQIYPSTIDAFVLSQSLPIKIILAATLIAPIGLIIGAYFPSGIARVSDLSPKLIPWCWAVNALFGMLASLSIPLIARTTALPSGIWIACLCYLLAIRISSRSFNQGKKSYG